MPYFEEWQVKWLAHWKIEDLLPAIGEELDGLSPEYAIEEIFRREDERERLRAETKALRAEVERLHTCLEEVLGENRLLREDAKR